jgi:hypothetical protein
MCAPCASRRESQNPFSSSLDQQWEKNAYLLDKIVIFDLRPAKHKTIEKKMLPFTRGVGIRAHGVLAAMGICAVARFHSRRKYKWSNAQMLSLCLVSVGNRAMINNVHVENSATEINLSFLLSLS